MITHLALRNFRAFKNQKFEFSRINIFVGPNNSGKSSALSALNLIAQTVIENEANVPLVLRGQFDDLGTFHDIVHGNNANTPMAIEFGLRRSSGSEKYTYNMEFKYRSQRRELEISKYAISDRKMRRIFEYKFRKDNYDLKYRGRDSQSILQTTNRRRPRFLRLGVVDPNLNSFLFRDPNSKTDPVRDDFLRKLEREIRHATSLLRLEFRAFDSLSPFRDPPTRTYLFSGAAPGHIGRTGANAIDMLVADNFRRGKEKANLVNRISDWFSEVGMARAIEVRALTSRHYEICVIGNDGKRHNLCDVGFGCSQVLPVLIAGLRTQQSEPEYSNPIYVVQEPEIHLHPNAQAELGSFFSRLFRRHGQAFIETHSSNLILRVQTEVARGNLSAEDVRIFYVSNKKKPPEVTVLRLDKTGFFKRKWPGGFFPQRQQESFELAKAASEQGSES